jgi:hypothetical protein
MLNKIYKLRIFLTLKREISASGMFGGAVRRRRARFSGGGRGCKTVEFGGAM